MKKRSAPLLPDPARWCGLGAPSYAGGFFDDEGC